MTNLLKHFEHILGPGGVLTGTDVQTRPNAPGRGPCPARAILRPRTTQQVSAIMIACHATGQTVVTQGGRTGKVDGCLAGDRDYVVSLERMTEITEIDHSARTMTVEAGATLQSAQEAARDANLLLPLDLGARGSATIGGNIATNAGGNRVLRYGMMRDQVQGLEAVLADGTVIASMGKMIKNNAGYDLKQLFIGSEGTLGIVTRAILKLTSAPRSQQTALVACNRFQYALDLLGTMRIELGEQLSAFEIMWRNYYRLATGSTSPALRAPLPADHPFYLLIETEGRSAAEDQQLFEQLLAQALKSGLIEDAVLARSQRERDQLWDIRDNTAAYQAWRPVFSFDISLNPDAIENYVNGLQQTIGRHWPDARMAAFGHLGDGNIHLAIAVGDGGRITANTLSRIVYEGLGRYQGSISAEHGIGLLRRDYLSYSRSPEEIALMRNLKRTLDPRGILNPGKVLRPAPEDGQRFNAASQEDISQQGQRLGGGGAE